MKMNKDKIKTTDRYEDVEHNGTNHIALVSEDNRIKAWGVENRWFWIHKDYRK
jgi:hypothetical protein